jgi:cell wall assembly regulator SMI1
MDALSDSWKRIADWHAAQGATAFALNPGASEPQIVAAERAIGRRFPADVRASWALHDGGGWLTQHGELLPLRGIVEQWELRRTLARDFGFGPDRRHIPVTDNSGDTLLIGPAGEVLDFDHEVGVRAQLAGSWAGFLAALAADLEAGRLVYFPKHRAVDVPDAYPEPTGRRRFVRDGHVFEIFRLGPSIITADTDPTGASMGRQISPLPEESDAWFDRLVAEKVALGYVETPPTS